MLEKLWELMDQALTATAFDGEESLIWSSIDGDDTRFLARRVIAAGRKNAVVGDQIRMLVDRWDDYRVVTILGPRVLQSAGWYPAHGIDLAQWGGPRNPPRAKRAKRSQTTAQPAQPAAGASYAEYTPNGAGPATEAYTYGG